MKSKQPNKAADYLSFITGYFYRRLRYEARTLEIRWTALMVLKDLAQLGPSNQRTLAEIEQTTEATMTVLIQQMLDKGWVTRKVSKLDSRAKLVAITKLGRDQLKQAGQALQQTLEQELGHLSSDEVSALEAALAPLVNAISNEIVKVSKGELQ